MPHLYHNSSSGTSKLAIEDDSRTIKIELVKNLNSIYKNKSNGNLKMKPEISKIFKMVDFAIRLQMDLEVTVGL